MNEHLSFFITGNIMVAFKMRRRVPTWFTGIYKPHSQTVEYLTVRSQAAHKDHTEREEKGI